jgi:thiol-disulfide isomerase/thioredoxin
MKQATDQKGLDAAVKGKKAMVLLHATWCPFCRAFKPIFDRQAKPSTGYEPVEVVLDDE